MNWKTPDNPPEDSLAIWKLGGVKQKSGCMWVSCRQERTSALAEEQGMEGEQD